ncbi:DUF2958 domain-containing protein [Pedobacter sp. PF22-3]|uniref:DUF2958 domain-containing protein n=1 Tax=Pedobacter sp. PF22-3 TaxID=2994467 RepID=UPI002245F3E2|nr:DUF2958 domain-containing protein [Pedobacter sp. PF22-3]MCX2495245.1 DUF2958 domain-containing protein [Pedobacter sp. PF22-3]
MKLFTKPQLKKLLENSQDINPDKDHPPVVKLFMTGTNCTWLLSELDPETQDIAFGLCDLGMGFPELGYVSLSEIKAAEGAFRFLERDQHFDADFPMSAYARAARYCEHIVTEAGIVKKFLPQ